MTRYLVRLRGENFLIDLGGGPQVRGFYTTRFVEAGSPEEAESKAVELVRQDERLIAGTLNEREDSPMIYLERLSELDSFEGRNVPGSGYTWF